MVSMCPRKTRCLNEKLISEFCSEYSGLWKGQSLPKRLRHE